MSDIQKLLANKMRGNQGTSSQGVQEVVPSTEAQQVVADFKKIRMTKEMFGEAQQLREAVAQEPKYMGEIIKANSDMITTLLKGILDSKNQVPAVGNDPTVKRLEDDIREIKSALSGGQDPIDAYVKVNNTLRGFIEQMGLGKPAVPSVQDGVAAIQLKKMEIEHDERKHQWDIEHDERARQWEEQKRQWDKEDMRWEQEFKLKRVEFSENRMQRQRATESMMDIIGALSDGVAGGGNGSSGTTISKRVSAPPVFQFECEDCHSTIVVSDPDATEAMCGKCGMIYDLNPSQAKPPETQGVRTSAQRPPTSPATEQSRPQTPTPTEQIAAASDQEEEE